MNTKTKAALSDIRLPGNQDDIPESVDAFLRTLARWAVEEMRHEPAFRADNMTSFEE